jgi:hypothetical protein
MIAVPKYKNIGTPIKKQLPASCISAKLPMGDSASMDSNANAIKAPASDASSLTTMEEATERACSMLPITSGGEREWTTQQLISNNSLQAPAAPLPPLLAGMMTSCYNKDTVVLPGPVSKPANLHGIHRHALSSRSAETDHSTEGWTQEVNEDAKQRHGQAVAETLYCQEEAVLPGRTAKQSANNHGSQGVAVLS